ncbi:MAG: hypothetical protein Q8J69_08640 [Sphingobacteriaceae bacterium]|nr:hypothetical protein [Sphingobacteriaceae bacterium]
MKKIIFALLLIASGCQYAAKTVSEESESETVKPPTLSAYEYDSIARVNFERQEVKRHKRKHQEIMDAIYVVKNIEPAKINNLNQLHTSLIDLEKYSKYEVSGNDPDSTKALTQKLIKLASSKRDPLYKKARKLIALEYKEKLWVDDIKVKHTDTYIEFEGYRYSLNRNIQTDFNAFQESGKRFGFKKVGFSDGYDKVIYTLD